ncbi:MAG: hypothetical protein GXZ08_02500 [Tissierellia bacterium]|nr:hypothetical protein [Tissierellia bacterium]
MYFYYDEINGEKLVVVESETKVETLGDNFIIADKPDYDYTKGKPYLVVEGDRIVVKYIETESSIGNKMLSEKLDQLIENQFITQEAIATMYEESEERNTNVDEVLATIYEEVSKEEEI